MAKRKRTRTRRRVGSSHVRRHSTRRRRRHGMGAGIFSNPLVGVAAGAVGAGLIGGFLSKPGSDGKPMIENPMLRLALVGAGGFFAGKMLRSPAIGLGAIAVVAYSGVANTLFKSGKTPYGLGDGAQVHYVDANLLSESTTLADGTTLADASGNVLGIMQGGQWRGPYSGTGY